MEFNIIKNQEFQFDIESNPEQYKKIIKRNTTISKANIILVFSDIIRIQLQFFQPEVISIGGIKYLDSLNVVIKEKNFLEFKDQFVFDEELNDYKKVQPVINI